jgi:hypothetical protein
MGKSCKGGRLALWVLGAAFLVPGGASAGQPCCPAEDSGSTGPARYYSPWTYRAPLLYRLCEEHRLHWGKHGPDCYPAGPWGYLIIKEPLYIFDPNRVPSLPAPASSASSSGAEERQ